MPRRPLYSGRRGLHCAAAITSLRDTVWAIDARKDKYENLVDRMLEYGEKNLDYKDIELKVEKVN